MEVSSKQWEPDNWKNAERWVQWFAWFAQRTIHIMVKTLPTSTRMRTSLGGGSGTCICCWSHILMTRIFYVFCLAESALGKQALTRLRASGKKCSCDHSYYWTFPTEIELIVAYGRCRKFNATACLVIEIIQRWFSPSDMPLWLCIKVKVIDTSMTYIYLQCISLPSCQVWMP